MPLARTRLDVDGKGTEFHYVGVLELNHFKNALTPPMGWNSWDCYGASVTEDEVKGNAEYMARYLLKYGWEYVVVDIQWYESTADSSQYHAFVPLEMGEYSRLIPSV